MSLSEEQLRKEFRRVDKDNNGSITVEELRAYYLQDKKCLELHPKLLNKKFEV